MSWLVCHEFLCVVFTIVLNNDGFNRYAVGLRICLARGRRCVCVCACVMQCSEDIVSLMSSIPSPKALTLFVQSLLQGCLSPERRDLLETFQSGSNV